MARRENQSLVVALIVMVMLVVVLCISTYIFWNKAQKMEKEAASAKSSSQSAAANLRKTLDEGNSMKQYMGYSEETSLDAIREGWESDMKLFASGIAEGDRNYRKLPEHLVAVVQKQNKNLVTLNNTIAKLQATEKSVRAQEQGRVEVAEKGQASATSDLDKRTKDFTKALADDRANAKSNTDKTQVTLRRVESDVKTVQKERDSMQADNDRLLAKNQQLEEKLRKLQNVSFERPDGKITYVNQRSRSVYINKGRADMISRQTTFSVYDVGENDMARLEPKGKVEVTKVMGEHLSEARILEDSVTNPVLTGDVIYSPVWEAGRPTHFALAGTLDADRDGKGDGPLIRNLISRNGGVVDAEVNELGERTGDLGIDTRYLVIGKRPIEADLAGLREFSRIRAEAESFGITEISLERFLTDMGYQPVGKTVKLGKGATPQPYSRKNQGTGRFRPRKPPQAKVNK